MNLEDEDFQLIDIASEEDFLSYSQLTDTFVDLRLSVALETQSELVRTSSSRHYSNMGRVLSFSEKEEEALGLGKERGKENCSTRKSLAWDNAFFTNPGFLELEELCLVNSGFKNLETSSHGSKGNLRSKICDDRYKSLKPCALARSGQWSQSSMRTKAGSSSSTSKLMSIRSSKRQSMTSGRSEAIAEVVHESHFVQKTSNRNELMKTTVHSKKPPLSAISRYGHKLVVSKQPILSSYESSTSVDSPCITSVNNAQTGCLLKSNMKKGDMKKVNSEDSGSLISPVSSSLRLPSEKIGFFETISYTSRHDQDGLKYAHKGRRTSKSEPCVKKQTQSLDYEEKENIFHPGNTVIELQPMKSSNQVDGSSISNGSQYSSSSSQRRLTGAKKPKPQSRSSKQSFAKVTPLKKSAFF